MEKDLNYWLQELQTNPPSLVPLLATPEGRKLLQVSSIENAAIGLWHAMDNKGMTTAECVEKMQPLFAQVPLARAHHAFHVDREPDVFFAWWRATQLTCPPAWRVDGAEKSLDASSALVGSMAWTLLCNNMRQPPKTLLPDTLKEPLWALLDASGEDSHVITSLASEPVRDVTDVYTSRCWKKLLNRLSTEELIILAPVFQVVIHPGAMAAFVGRCQNEPESTMDRILDALPNGLPFPVQEFHKNRNLCKNTWACPLHGLLLVPCWSKQKEAGLHQDERVTTLLSMNDALGLDATQHILRSQIHRLLGRVPAPDFEMEHTALASALDVSGM